MTRSLVDIPADEAALEHCRAITRREARNFYYGLRLLPEPQRSALFCVYAWMREVDDIADTDRAGRDPAAELDHFRVRTRQAFAGEGDPTPMWRAFTGTVRRFSLDPAPFDDMISGQQDDLVFRQPETMDDLVAYCRKVASSVGRICVSIWGYDQTAALDLADQRGIAFQMTNILRDIREDHANGRTYLPSAVLREHQLDIASLLEWRSPPDCRRLVEKLLAVAEDHYLSSSPLESLISAPCRPTLRAMTGIYHGLLQRMSRDPRVVVGPGRVRLGRLQKISIALRAKLPVRTS